MKTEHKMHMTAMGLAGALGVAFASSCGNANAPVPGHITCVDNGRISYNKDVMDYHQQSRAFTDPDTRFVIKLSEQKPACQFTPSNPK